MKATLCNKQEIATGMWYFEFDLYEEINFKAGQFFRLTHTNLRETDTRGNKRYFGFLNTPAQNKKAMMVTMAGVSAYKRSLMESPNGTEMEIGEVGGSMVLPDDPASELVFVTEGIGIAPLISIFREVKEKSLGTKITLIYINRDEASTGFLEELKGYASENPNIKVAATMISDPQWSGEMRPLSGELVKAYVDNLQAKTYFVTGSVKFVPGAVRTIKELGVDPAKIKFEIFTGY